MRLLTTRQFEKDLKRGRKRGTSKIDVAEARIAGGCLLRLKEGAVLHALKQPRRISPS